MPKDLAAAQLREHPAEPLTNIELAEDAPDCQDVFQRIAKSCMRAIRRDCKLAIAGKPDAIHNMRVELTRLHAAALFFAPTIDDTAWAPIDTQLRWLNSALGKARDRDVDIDYAVRGRYRYWAEGSRRSLLRSQEKAHRRLATRLGSAHYRHLVSELDDWISKASLPSDSRETNERIEAYCQHRLQEWRHEISRRGRHFDALRREPRHQLRIQCKNFRYMVDCLLGLDIPISREDFCFSEAAKRAHRILGDLRDLRHLRKVIGRSPPGYRRCKRKLSQDAKRCFRRGMRRD